MKNLLITGIIFHIILVFYLQSFSQNTLTVVIPAEKRTQISFNKEWKFSAEKSLGSGNISVDESKWTSINLPHTWNAEDAFDDRPGYLQDSAWYRKKFKVAENLKGKRLFLYFEGVNQVADVFVNGKYVGNHIGGYTAFVFDITKYVNYSAPDFENVLAVRVNNVSSNNIPPSPTADFNLYGGIYRDVYLMATDPVHLSLTDYASSGVFIDTPQVSEERATVKVRGKITNDSFGGRKIKVKNTVFDKDNVKIAESESSLEIEAQVEANFEQTLPEIKKPQLWSPDSPYLYNISTEVYDEKDQLIDSIKNPLGFRWFNFDPEKGFSLNGKPLKLIGGNRHQDYQGLGNALPDELQVKDLEIIKKTGMNWVLLAHYPHDPAVLEAADRLGLIVWEETPILRQINTSPLYSKISEQMLTEMIRQHYNHPSVVFWCYMNEIFLRMKSETDYVKKTAEFAKMLEETAKREDPYRLTAISFNRAYTERDFYEEAGLTQIPDVVGWHLYFGWYYGQPEDLGGFLDDYHRRYPERRILVSEYGADSDSRIHSTNPQMKDYSTEWAQIYHEKYVAQMSERTYLGGFAVWNMFDFGSETRGESTPHINKKGIYTFNREPKDIAFFYRAQFSAAPVLHIASREWSKRAATSDAKDSADPQSVGSTQPIKIYTNLREVELLLNGKSLGKKTVDDSRTLLWNVKLQRGSNKLEARGGGGGKEGEVLSDKAEIQYLDHLQDAAGARLMIDQLAINAGSGTEFLDETGTLWEADRAYTPGGWGFVSEMNEPVKRIERNILETADDPLYQTYRRGLSGYRFDLAGGEYEIELRFAEPAVFKSGERVFSVSINGKNVIENFDLFNEKGLFKAVSKTFVAQVQGNQGLMINFQASKGGTILSGVRIKKMK